MSNRRFEMYQYRQVLVRIRQGDSNRVIARSGLMGRNKVAEVRLLAKEQGWLNPDRPLPDDTELAQYFDHQQPLPSSCISSLEPWRIQITEWHAAGIAGTTICSALARNHGFKGSYSAVHRFVRQLAEAQLPEVPLRLCFQAGEAAQVDFGAGPTITNTQSGEIFKTWFFVMTLCWSRHQYAEMVQDQSIATWLSCHRHAFEWFGGVPSKIIIDNPKCAITKACIYDPVVQRAYAEYAEGYTFKIDPCPPRDPQKKGIVEAGVKYIKRSFLPLREFRSMTEANQQLQEWVLGEAGNRIHGTTREVPLKRFVELEKGLLISLPSIPPECATWAKVKVHRDTHVQYQYAYYSVPFYLVGKQLWLKATDTMIKLYLNHEQVACHTRLARKGTRSTVADHLPEAAQVWQTQDVQWCLTQAQRIGVSCHKIVLALFNDNVLIKLRAVQGILRLEKPYGTQRLEAACHRADHFSTLNYSSIKTILKNGLDQQALAPAFDQLSSTYTEGGLFCRDTSTLIVH
jgi:transposase